MVALIAAAVAQPWLHACYCNEQVLQSMKASERQGLTTLQLRAKATEFALATVDKQRTAFKRYGVWGYWDEPYMTLQPEYEAAQIEVFGKVK
jgi:isoleucyl-tRNA synthetase